MARTKGQLTVTGKREVIRAFSQLSDDMSDLTDENTDLGQKLVQDVRQNTRRASGVLAASWIGGGDPTRITFSNPQQYAAVQEFGSERRNIEPTNAVKLAFDQNQEVITDGYADATRKRAKRRNIRTD